MSLARRIRLNPCDYLYYAHHRMLQRTVDGGTVTCMMIETRGHPDPNRIRDALAAAMLAHPVTLARLRVSLPMGRPYWKIPRSLRDAAHRGAGQAHSYDDLRSARQWRTRLEQLCTERYRPRWDLAAGLQIRLEQYALPEGQTRFCLRWPHLMMDAEGAQLFLAEIGRLDPADAASQGRAGPDSPSRAPPDSRIRGEIPPSPEIPSDDHPVDALSNYSFLRRLRLLRRGLAPSGDRGGLHIRPLIPASGRKRTGLGLVYRNFRPEQVQRIEANAKCAAPRGPALYARYLAASVLRALHRLYTERGVASDAYLITLPLRVTLPDHGDRCRAQRPVPGNYLVSPILCGRRQVIEDRRALGTEIVDQLESYRRAHADLIQWAMVWAASFLRASLYPLLFKLPLGFESLCSGFSYYGEAGLPVRSIGGAPVTNLWGAGPLATPPGWNPTFSRFRDRLNLTLTWNRPDVPDALARRYAELIEEEIFDAS